MSFIRFVFMLNVLGFKILKVYEHTGGIVLFVWEIKLQIGRRFVFQQDIVLKLHVHTEVVQRLGECFGVV